MMSVVVYADGSGRADAGPGGVGYVALIGDLTIEGSLSLPAATNQQAEILAAAYALDQLDPADNVTVWSDSEYVVKGMSEWLPGWIRCGWRTASGSPVRNQPHWRRLLVAVEKHAIVEFKWCRSHVGNPHNERADELARLARLARTNEVAGKQSIWS